MNIKKILMTLTAAALACSMLASCGDSSSDTDKTANTGTVAKTSDGKDVTESEDEKTTELSIDSLKMKFRFEGKTVTGFKADSEEKLKVLGDKDALRIRGHITKSDNKTNNSSDDYIEIVFGEYDSRDKKKDGKINYFFAYAWTASENDENKAKIKTLIDNFTDKLEYTDEEDEKYHYAEKEAYDGGSLFFQKAYNEHNTLLHMVPASNEDKKQYRGDYGWNWNIGPDSNTGMEYIFKHSQAERNSD